MNRHTPNTPQDAQLSRETLELAAGDLVRLTAAQGVSICVRDGTAWITQDHDHDDIVIGASESFVVDRHGLTLVTPVLTKRNRKISSESCR